MKRTLRRMLSLLTAVLLLTAAACPAALAAKTSGKVSKGVKWSDGLGFPGDWYYFY